MRRFDLTGIAVYPPTLQRKAIVSTPDDPLEREADAVADRVMGKAEPDAVRPVSVGVLQRKCAECEDKDDEEEEKTIQTKRAQSGAEAALDTGTALRVAARGGAPLAAPVLSYFEPRFGLDLSRVRVHADGEAAEAARGVHARAYTIGHNIVFGHAEYAPHTSAGKRLLAHELAHVAQQGSMGASTKTIARDAGDLDADLDAGAPGESATGGEQVAQILSDALQRSDDEAVLTSLAGRTLAELAIIKKAYQARAGAPLEDDLQQKLSKGALPRALFLLRAPSPTMDLAQQLKAAMERTITDTDAITGALSGRTYDQWAEIQQAYREMTGQRELASDLRDAVSSGKWSEIQRLLPVQPATPASGLVGAGAATAPGADTQARAAATRAQIDDAISGLHTDREQLFGALTGRSKEELAEIAKPYGGLAALRDKLKDALSEVELGRINELFGDTSTSLAMRIHAELESFQPSKESVLVIAGGRAPSELTQMYEEFARLYRTSLDSALVAKFGKDAPVLQPLSRLEDPDFRARWEAAVKKILADLQRSTRSPAEGGMNACRFPDIAAGPDPETWRATKTGGTRAGEEHNAGAVKTNDIGVRPVALPPRAAAAEPPAQSVAEGGQGGSAWTPKGGDPFTAITELATGIGSWECDCAMFVEIVWLLAWRSLLPVEEFNKRFDGLKVRRIGTTGLAQEHHVFDEPGFDERWKQAPVGVKVSWENDSAVARPPWKDEHAIKGAKGADPKDDTYYAHPEGNDLNEESVRLLLARYSDDFPNQVFELEEMRLMGFTSQVEEELLPSLKKLEGIRKPAETLSGLDPSVSNEITARRATPDRLPEWTRSLAIELVRAQKAIQALGELASVPDKSDRRRIWGQEYFFAKLVQVSPVFREVLVSPVEATIVKQALLTWLFRPGTAEEKSQYIAKYIRRNDLSLPL